MLLESPSTAGGHPKPSGLALLLWLWSFRSGLLVLDRHFLLWAFIVWRSENPWDRGWHMWGKGLWAPCGQELVRMLPQVLFSTVTTAGSGLWSSPSETGTHCYWFPRSGDWETWVEQVQPQVWHGVKAKGTLWSCSPGSDRRLLCSRSSGACHTHM